MKPDIHIARVASTDDYTAGVIKVFGVPACVSIELPWLDNAVGLSCIPAGDYMINLKHWSPKFKSCFQIVDVPGRTHILMHAANRASELRGCLAPGKSFGMLQKEFAVLSSRAALQDIRNCFPAEQDWASIRITDDWRNYDD